MPHPDHITRLASLEESLEKITSSTREALEQQIATFKKVVPNAHDGQVLDYLKLLLDQIWTGLKPLKGGSIEQRFAYIFFMRGITEATIWIEKTWGVSVGSAPSKPDATDTTTNTKPC